MFEGIERYLRALAPVPTLNYLSNICSKEVSMAGVNESARVLSSDGNPIEFIHNGIRFHIHAVVSRWRESGGWWNRIQESDLNSDKSILDSLDDGSCIVWRVEAAPIGALATFEIELDEKTKCWQIRPTSRSA